MGMCVGLCIYACGYTSMHMPACKCMCTHIYICIPFILFLLCKTYQYFKFQILQLLELQRNKYIYFDPLHRVPTNSGYQFMFYSLENVIIYTLLYHNKIIAFQIISIILWHVFRGYKFRGIYIKIYVSPGLQLVSYHTNSK